MEFTLINIEFSLNISKMIPPIQNGIWLKGCIYLCGNGSKIFWNIYILNYIFQIKYCQYTNLSL